MKRKFLLAVIALAAFATVTRQSAAQSTDDRQRVDTTVALVRNGAVSVSVHSGRVSISGTSGSSVHVRGTVARGDLDVRARSSGIRITTDPEGPLSGRSDLEITVPIGTSVALEGFSTSFTVKGVKGAARIETVSGTTEVTDAVGRVQVESVSGGISIRGVDGNVRAEAVSSGVEITNLTGDAEVESVSGGISIVGAISKSVRAETVSGAVRYSGTFDPAGYYELKSHSGRISIGVPADAGATVGLQTFSGTVDSEFPVTLESGRTRMGHESRFEFKIGNGRSRVILETFSGSIDIRRSTNRDNQEQ